jgi:hypothetical protein
MLFFPLYIVPYAHNFVDVGTGCAVFDGRCFFMYNEYKKIEERVAFSSEKIDSYIPILGVIWGDFRRRKKCIRFFVSSRN